MDKLNLLYYKDDPCLYLLSFVNFTSSASTKDSALLPSDFLSIDLWSTRCLSLEKIIFFFLNLKLLLLYLLLMHGFFYDFISLILLVSPSINLLKTLLLSYWWIFNSKNFFFHIRLLYGLYFMIVLRWSGSCFIARTSFCSHQSLRVRKFRDASCFVFYRVALSVVQVRNELNVTESWPLAISCERKRKIPVHASLSVLIFEILKKLRLAEIRTGQSCLRMTTTICLVFCRHFTG